MSPVRPRIGFLCQRLLLGYGVDLVVDRQARGLAARGYPVTVYAAEISDHYRDVPYRTVRLDRSAGIEAGFHDPPFVRQAIEYLGGQPVDLWVAQTPPFYEVLFELGRPGIHLEHGTPDGRFFARERGRELDWMTRLRHEHVFNQLPNTQVVGVVSEFLRAGLPEPSRSQACVFYNGADHYPAAPASEVARLRRDLGIEDGQVVLVYVSRIVFEQDDQPYKGVHELLARWPDFARRHRRARLVLAGRARPEDAARVTARGVIPCLNVPPERLPALLAGADLYVCPSRWEGFNLPVAEAQRQGTPVLAYRRGAHPEVVAPPPGGVLAEGRRGWWAALARLVEEPAALAAMRAPAAAFAARFTWRENVAGLEATLLALHGIALGDPDPRPLTERTGVQPAPSWRRTRLILGHVARAQGLPGLAALARNWLLKRGER